MPDLSFSARGAEVVPFAATPQLSIALDITCMSPEQPIESILLRCAVRIQAGTRAHDAGERARLSDLFGTGDVWARSSKSLQWAQLVAVVPPFESNTTLQLLLPCTHDLASAASRYLHGLASGEIPITLLLSGTVFFRTAAGLQITQLPWDREASLRIPVTLWRQAIEQHFPNASVLSLRTDLFERLERYRTQSGSISYEQALETLLDRSDAGAVR